MYHVSAQGIDERMINVHYYYLHQELRANSSCVQAHYKEETEPVAIFNEEALQDEDDIQDSDGEEDSDAMKLEG